MCAFFPVGPGLHLAVLSPRVGLFHRTMGIREKPRNKHTDNPDKAPNATSWDGNITPSSCGFPIPRYGPPNHNRNTIVGIHILTKISHTRNNASLDRDTHNPPSHEGKITTSPTPVDI